MNILGRNRHTLTKSEGAVAHLPWDQLDDQQKEEVLKLAADRFAKQYGPLFEKLSKE